MDGFHSMQTVSLVRGETDCCEDFPTCTHPSGNLWSAICPKCGSKAFAVDLLGPYDCSCWSIQFHVLVEGWVDKREVEDD
jgi:hypothetical protein